MLTCVLLASTIHELGHFAVLRLFGARVGGLRVHALGAVMETDTARLSYAQELAATLAGPGANLLLAVGCSLWDAEQCLVLIGASLVLGAFNLLPVLPLDGGRALYLLVAWLLGAPAGERVSRMISLVCALLLGLGLIFLMIRTGGSLWLFPPAVAALAAAMKRCRKG